MSDHGLDLRALQPILTEAAKRHHVSVEGILGKRVTGSVAAARRWAMFEARERLKWSYPEIAVAFQRRDHTTVMSACKRERSIRDAQELGEA
jgi:chromosomal replication initiation ATPase DnaA